MNRKLFVFMALVLSVLPLKAQPGRFLGTQNRVVVFARFNGDPEMDTERSHFENMFNGDERSLKSYFQDISQGRFLVQSHLYPANTGVNSSFELKYCYYCYDKNWRGNYPNCKGKDITANADINIGFIIKELVEKLEASENIPDADELDKDNDGCVDNFVVVLSGAGRGQGMGIFTPQVATVSAVFTKAQGDILLKGKIVKDFTITYERNSLDTHCRFLLNHLGFPNAYATQGIFPRSVGAWDPMDGPALSFPLAYNRMKYSEGNWVGEIPEIVKPGEYTLGRVDTEDCNACKIASSNPNQYWVLEYRDKSVKWDENLPETGLLIYRVDTRYTGVVGKYAEVYVHRKDGTPTVAGNLDEAVFSDVNGRMAFNAVTNPYPFFTEGDVPAGLDISDIMLAGNGVSFRVNSLPDAIVDTEIDKWGVYVSSSSPRTLCITGDVEELHIFNLSGVRQGVFRVQGRGSVHLGDLCAGIYVARLKKGDREQMYKFVLG